MRHALRFLTITLTTMLCGAAHASTLTLTVPNHMVTSHRTDAHSTTLLRVLWTDEGLVTDVQLDVYQLPQMQATTEHYGELRRAIARSRPLAALPRARIPR